MGYDVLVEHVYGAVASFRSPGRILRSWCLGVCGTVNRVQNRLHGMTSKLLIEVLGRTCGLSVAQEAQALLREFNFPHPDLVAGAWPGTGCVTVKDGCHQGA